MKSKTGILSITLAGVFSLILGAADSAQDSRQMLAVVNGFVIDGSGAAPLEKGTILIKGNRILACGPKDRVEIPAGATIIDARGKSVLPGLIDSHVHNAFDPALRRRFLEIGITSVCDLGSPVARMELFARTEHEGEPVARGFKAGPILTAPGGLPDAVLKEDLNYEIGTIDQAKQAVPFLLKRGADVLKVYLEPAARGQSFPMLTENTLKALTETAHTNHLLVRAHVTKLASLPLALGAGVDVIEHLPKPNLSEASLTELISKSQEPEKALYQALVVPEYESLFPRMIQGHIVLVPTLLADVGRFHLEDKATPWQKILARGALDLVGRYHTLGGTIALGTDFNPNNKPSRDILFREMDLLRAAGLSPMEVLVAATKNAALVSGHGHELGILASGYLADLVIIDGNPLEDPKAWKSLAVVIQNGRIAWQDAARPGTISPAKAGRAERAVDEFNRF
jgi:imidazolonepropionase-like amidohydrolase